MKLPISIAEKLLLLAQGSVLTGSQLRHSIVDKMVDDGILLRQRTGSNRYQYLHDKRSDLQAYLHNHFGVTDLAAYVADYGKEDMSRTDAVKLASDSKLNRRHRTFQGFLVNSYQPVRSMLGGQPFVIQPPEGSYCFINDPDRFEVPEEVVIVGIENPENFRRIARQAYLFGEMKVLFVSRYPQSQSADLIRWLQRIPNAYLHYGDFDFAGIRIYLDEFRKHLGPKACFFLPPEVEALIVRYGNRELYDRQLHLVPADDAAASAGPEVRQLIALLHQHKKALEQEALIGA